MSIENIFTLELSENVESYTFGEDNLLDCIILLNAIQKELDKIQDSKHFDFSSFNVKFQIKYYSESKIQNIKKEKCLEFQTFLSKPISPTQKVIGYVRTDNIPYHPFFSLETSLNNLYNKNTQLSNVEKKILFSSIENIVLINNDLIEFYQKNIKNSHSSTLEKFNIDVIKLKDIISNLQKLTVFKNIKKIKSNDTKIKSNDTEIKSNDTFMNILIITIINLIIFVFVIYFFFIKGFNSNDESKINKNKEYKNSINT